MVCFRKYITIQSDFNGQDTIHEKDNQHYALFLTSKESESPPKYSNNRKLRTMSSGVETTNSSRGFHSSNSIFPQSNIQSIADTENTLLDEKLDSKDLVVTKSESKEEKEESKEGETKKKKTLNDDMPWQTLVSYVDELTIGARRDSKGKYVDGVSIFPKFGKQKVPKVPSNCFPATFYDRLVTLPQ